MNDEIILQTIQLTKRFRNFTAVHSLNLTIRRGDIYGFLGPNGAGKSTTIRMMLGLIKPTAGEVKIFNTGLSANRNKALGKIGALVEKPSFYNYLTARQNLQILATLINLSGKRDIDRVLEIAALSDRADDKVKTYSQGMKQRLGIAQALLGHPELIILDEPTSGLDPHGMKEIRKLIIQLANQGLTIFLSSHLLHEIEQICNKMAIINKGKLTVQGDVETLMNSEIELVVIKIDRSDEAAKLLKTHQSVQIVDVSPNELKINVRVNEIPQLNKLLVTAGFDVFTIQPRRSLEDYFLSIVDGEIHKN